jgi:hypothetical protein
MSRYTMIACSVIALAILSGCGVPHFRAEAGYFRPSSKASFSGSASSDTLVDLSATASLPESANSPYGAVELKMGGFRLDASGWMSSQNVDATALATFNFNGVAYSSGVPLTTKLDLSNVQLAFEYSLIPSPVCDTVDLSLGAGVDLFQVDLQLKEPTLGIDQSLSQVAPIPVLAATLEIKPVSWLEIFAQGRGLVVDSSWVGGGANTKNANAKFFDLWTGVRGNWTWLTGTVGYKLIYVNADVQDAGSASANYHGLLITVGASF